MLAAWRVTRLGGLAHEGRSQYICSMTSGRLSVGAVKLPRLRVCAGTEVRGATRPSRRVSSLRASEARMTAAEAPERGFRRVMHCDLDCFFAAVEELDDPSLRGRPVIVGGDPDRRGVVSTANYAARRFGVHSAMAAALARRLCPDAVFLRPRFDRYRELSERVMAILDE